MEITLKSVIAQSEDQVSTDLEGEVVIMGIQQGNYYSMNSVLSRIWTLAGKPIKLSALCDALMEEYEVERDVCEKQVLEAVQSLAQEKLVTVCAS